MFTIICVMLGTMAAPVPDEATRIAALVRQLESGTPGERVIAAELLGDLGPKAATAAPALARVALQTRFAEAVGGTRLSNAADVFLFDACFSALFRMGPKAAPSFAKLIAHEERLPRLRMIWHLPLPPPVEAIPNLIRCLSDDDAEIVGWAAHALGTLGPAASEAIPKLVEVFRNSKPDPMGAPGSFQPHPRITSVATLMRIGEKAVPAIQKEVLPLLIEDVKASRQVREVLPLLRELGAPAIPDIVKTVHHCVETIHKANAAVMLPQLGPEGVKAFVRLLDNEDEEIRIATVVALKSQSREIIAGLVPRLLARMPKGNYRYRVAAVCAFSQLNDKATLEIIAAVLPLLRDTAFLDAVEEGGWEGVSDLVYALRRFGPHSPELILATLKAPNTVIQRTAIQAILSYPAMHWSALPVLRRMATDDPDIGVAATAAAVATCISHDPADLDALFARGGLRSGAALHNKIAPAFRWTSRIPVESRHELAPREERDGLPPEDIPSLIERLRHADRADDPEEGLRRVAKVGPAASDALPVLIELIPKLDDKHTAALMRAIVSLGPKAKDAVPAIANRLPDQPDEYRLPAVLCLGDIGPAAKDTVPAIRKLLAEANPELRLAAAYALARINGDMADYRAAFERGVERDLRGPVRQVFLAELFERIAPHAPELIPVAAKWLELGSPDAALMSGLTHYGTKAKPAIPGLRKMLRSADATSSQLIETCRTLAAIGPEAHEAIPDLRRLFPHEILDVAITARDAIRRLQEKK